MRRAAIAPFAVLLLLLVPILLVVTGCWPGIPIAAIAAAAGGGGGGGGGGNNIVAIQGSIVTDPSVFANGFGADHEFNDRLGMSFELGPVSKGRPAHVAGEAGTTATIHALVDGAAGRSVVGRELLSAGGTSFDARTGTVAAPVALARIDRELFLLDAGADGTAASIRVTPLESNFVQRRFALPGSITPAGMTALSDALLVLDAANGTTRLVALDAADATPLFAADLGVAGLRHLAGAEQLATGTPRLFTSHGSSVLEVQIAQSGRDRRFTGVAAAFDPKDLAGGIAALGYDGVLVQVLDGAGTLHSFEPDGTEIATRSFVAAGTNVVSLVAHLDLGFDGYHFEVAAGDKVSVDVRLDDGDSATLFAFGLARTDLEQEKAGKPLFFTQLASGARHAEVDNTAGATPLECDLAVGARAGAGRYALALGDGIAVGFPKEPPPARDDDATKLASWLEPQVFATLPVERLVEIYRDPLLPDFDPGRVVLGRADKATSLTVASPRGFALTCAKRSPAGYEVWSHADDGSWQGPQVATLHGSAPKGSTRREESRRTLAVLSRLAGTPGVSWREPAYRVHSLAAPLPAPPPVLPNDPQFQAQKWAFDEMHVRDAWNVTVGSTTTVLAIVDTGIRTDNVDLAGAGTNYPMDGIDEGFDFVTDVTPPGSNTGSADGDGLDADPFDEGTFADDDHHGSHCAGTIGTKGNNTVGLCGINWDCRLMAVRGLGVDGSGSTTDIAEGILYAAKLANSSGTLPDDAAAVINLSLGLSSNSSVIHNAIQSAIAQGCIVCCAAGNNGNGSAVLFPAAFPESIAVAACDIHEDIATYSNTGPQLDVTGPGGANTFLDSNGDGWVDEIWSTIGSNQIAALAGTSMACSEVSGVCGLIKSIDPTITQDRMRSLLEATATDLNTSPGTTPGFDVFSGFGLVNVSAALPVLKLSADEVDLGKTGLHTLVQAQNVGGKGSEIIIDPNSLNQTVLQGAGGWLTTTIAADKKTILLDADRGALANGDQQVQVDVSTNAGSGSFLVDLTQDAAITSPQDVGTVTIQLFGSDGVTLVTSTTANAANGYAYHLPLVPLGKYFLRAGTDVNQNGVLGEPGELFGAYPRGALPEPLEFDEMTAFHLDMVVK